MARPLCLLRYSIAYYGITRSPEQRTGALAARTRIPDLPPCFFFCDVNPRDSSWTPGGFNIIHISTRMTTPVVSALKTVTSRAL
jgi:hypothetical protein